jgi:hypothetical protein
MNLTQKIKGSLLASGIVLTLGIMGCNQLRKYEDSFAKASALEIANKVIEEESEKNPDGDFNIAKIKLWDDKKGVNYDISVEQVGKTLTVQRPWSSDSIIILIDHDNDGTLDEAYIVKSGKRPLDIELYTSEKPKQLEGLYREELKNIKRIMKNNNKYDRKLPNRIGQLV